MTGPHPAASIESRTAGRHVPLRRIAFVVAALSVSTGLIALWSLSRGEPTLGLAETWLALTGQGPERPNVSQLVVLELRLPRVLLACLAGAALGLAGTILQDTLRNPIADPGLLGVSQAATLVVAVALFFPGTLPDMATPVLAAAAGLAAGWIFVLLAGRLADPVRLILIGVLLAGLFGTTTTVLLFALPPEQALQTAELYRFSIGSLVASSWERVAVAAPWLMVTIPIALLCGRPLNLLQLGDDVASGLGMNVTRTRFGLMAVSVLLIAPVVAVAGPIAAVALLSPHIARFALRTSNAFAILPASALVGALVVLVADLLARLALYPIEVPAGVWTIIIAGPAAIWFAATRIRSAPSAAPA